MNRPAWAHLFERFRDLNLFALRASLRYGLVARGHWCTGSYHYDDDVKQEAMMCPLQHGLSSAIECGASSEAIEIAARNLGVHPDMVEGFTSAWDFLEIEDRELLAVVESILRERQDDADAVQAMIGEEVAVCV